MEKLPNQFLLGNIKNFRIQKLVVVKLYKVTRSPVCERKTSARNFFLKLKNSIHKSNIFLIYNALFLLPTFKFTRSWFNPKAFFTI